MKKLLLALCVLLTLGLGAVYYLIPGTIIISDVVRIHCNSDAVFRILSDDTTLSKWQEPSGAAAGATGKSYTITKKMTNAFDILIKQDTTGFASTLTLVPVKKDSVILYWQSVIPATLNPVKRIAAYNRAVSIKKGMDDITNRMQTYFSKPENVYGFSFREGTVTDTFFISVKSVSAVYPGTAFIYALVNRLKDFCSKQDCRITGSPMLNITRLSPLQYKVMVALPVSRLLQDGNEIAAGKMVAGRFIITEVTGGSHKVQETLRQIQLYFLDYGRTSMAIPFDYLITDRQKEPDTSKWITRIYAPVY